MKYLKKLLGLFTPKSSETIPLLIIKKESNGPNIKEYKSIEDAIADLENDPNVSPEKVARLRLSLKNLKNKTSIKIKNGEIVK